MEYEYWICNYADKELFNKIQKKLNTIPNMNPVELIHDVDDSLYQVYEYHGYKVELQNSTYMNELVIKSEVNIEHLIMKQD